MDCSGNVGERSAARVDVVMRSLLQDVPDEAKRALALLWDLAQGRGWAVLPRIAVRAAEEAARRERVARASVRTRCWALALMREQALVRAAHPPVPRPRSAECRSWATGGQRRPLGNQRAAGRGRGGRRQTRWQRCVSRLARRGVGGLGLDRYFGDAELADSIKHRNGLAKGRALIPVDENARIALPRLQLPKRRF